MQAILTKVLHLTESWKRRASDKELEQYLSAGIAQIEAERDNLRAELAASAQDVEGVVEALRAEFPLLDDEGLDQKKHHCEWAMQQDRKRLHKLLAAMTQAAPRLDEQAEEIEQLRNERDALVAKLSAIKGQELSADPVKAQLLEALEELIYARTDKAEEMAYAAIAAVRKEGVE